MKAFGTNIHVVFASSCFTHHSLLGKKLFQGVPQEKKKRKHHTMLLLCFAEWFVWLLMFVMPKRWADRIKSNAQPRDVLVFRTGLVHSKTRMTMVESAITTLLFDLALFGTNNRVINNMIRSFTKFQGQWNVPFASNAHRPKTDAERTARRAQAAQNIYEFARALEIQVDPWVWDRAAGDYESYNDFFSRKYAAEGIFAWKVGSGNVVSPACCTATIYNNNCSLTRLLIKGCEYKIENVGIPREHGQEDVRHTYGRHKILVGYLSPKDYHRVHAPVSGRCVHLKIENEDHQSASVKFFGGRFNLLNANKRLVCVIEQKNRPSQRACLVVIGGVGVNTIRFSTNLLGKFISKGDELATFLAGGSAFALFSNFNLQYSDRFVAEATNTERSVELMVGESL